MDQICNKQAYWSAFEGNLRSPAFPLVLAEMADDSPSHVSLGLGFNSLAPDHFVCTRKIRVSFHLALLNFLSFSPIYLWRWQLVCSSWGQIKTTSTFSSFHTTNKVHPSTFSVISQPFPSAKTHSPSHTSRKRTYSLSTRLVLFCLPQFHGKTSLFFKVFLCLHLPQIETKSKDNELFIRSEFWWPPLQVAIDRETPPVTRC